MSSSYYNQEKATHPGQFTLLPVVNIIPYNDIGQSAHQVLNIFPLIREINIYESIYQPFITGNVVILDTANMFESEFPVVGMERLEFQIMTPGVEGFYDFQSQTGFPVHVYAVTDRTSSPQDLAQQYILHFCSQEMFRNKTSYVSKAVYNTHENIVAELLERHMNSKKALILEKSVNRHKYVLPYANPLTHINTIAEKTQSAYHDNPGYLFFENMYGFNFRSLQGLTNLNNGDVRQSKHGVVYESRRTDTRGGGDANIDFKLGGIYHYDIKQQFDTIDSVVDGAYSSELIFHDQLTKKFGSKIFKYNEHFSGQPKMEEGQGSKMGNLIYKDNKQFQELPTKRFFKSSTSKLFSQSSITQASEVDITQKRASKKSHISNCDIEIEVPGYLGIATGDVIDVNFPKKSHTTTNTYEQDAESRMSGKYLIKSIRHTFDTSNQGMHKMLLRISKDAFNVVLPNTQTDTFTSLETDKNRGVIESPQI